MAGDCEASTQFSTAAGFAARLPAASATGLPAVSGTLFRISRRFGGGFFRAGLSGRVRGRSAHSAGVAGLLDRCCEATATGWQWPTPRCRPTTSRTSSSSGPAAAGVECSTGRVSRRRGPVRKSSAGDRFRVERERAGDLRSRFGRKHLRERLEVLVRSGQRLAMAIGFGMRADICTSCATCPAALTPCPSPKGRGRSGETVAMAARAANSPFTCRAGSHRAFLPAANAVAGQDLPLGRHRPKLFRRQRADFPPGNLAKPVVHNSVYYACRRNRHTPCAVLVATAHGVACYNRLPAQTASFSRKILALWRMSTGKPGCRRKSAIPSVNGLDAASFRISSSSAARCFRPFGIRP